MLALPQLPLLHCCCLPTTRAYSALYPVLPPAAASLKKHTGRELPIDACPIRFGSWMGGDRDGNPNVTAKVGAVAMCPRHVHCALDRLHCFEVVGPVLRPRRQPKRHCQGVRKALLHCALDMLHCCEVAARAATVMAIQTSLPR